MTKEQKTLLNKLDTIYRQIAILYDDDYINNSTHKEYMLKRVENLQDMLANLVYDFEIEIDNNRTA